MSFSRYNPEDQVVSSETVVRGLWSGDSNTISQFFTQSGYTEYYLDVLDSTSNIQFDIQFGNLYGSGSTAINAAVPGNTPSRVVYGQYRNLVYGTETGNFVFNSSVSASSIYVINVARSRYKESLLPGSFELTLASGSGSPGTSSIITLIDDSTTTSISRFLGENRYYNVISGSIANGAFSSGSVTNYGFFLPDLGVVILDSGSLSKYIRNVSSSFNALNLYTSISSGSLNTSFKLKSSETVSSTYFFTRVKNSEFNYTTNPSIIDDNGNLLYTTLINSPQTFPTTVGMYNDNNELLAVAKLSRPLAKDFTKEALIRIKLDY